MDNEMKKWVLVIDNDKVSKEQLNICMHLKPPLKGVINCSDKHNDESSQTLCKELDFFPAFCDTKTNICQYGIRETREEIWGLVNIDTKGSKQTQMQKISPSQTHK
jgi:hypothetical protein